MKILFGVLNMGLGHASRSLGLIKALLEKGVRVDVASAGTSLLFLREELKEYADELTFREIADYKITYSSVLPLLLKLSMQIPKVIKAVKLEHRQVKELVQKEKYDFIVSDHRYGFYDERVPSYFITHQITLMPPVMRNKLAKVSARFHLKQLKKFNGIIVPDFAGEPNLSGKLSHGYDDERLYFAGPLCRNFNSAPNIKGKYKVLAIVSGPEPQKTLLKNELSKFLSMFQYRSVIVCGEPESHYREEIGNLALISHVNEKKLLALMNESDIIVSRSGYTTVMEIAATRKKAVFIPTTGQTEQEYLADYYESNKWYNKVAFGEWGKLADAIENAKHYSGFPGMIDCELNCIKTAEYIIKKAGK